jgi:hypothetical protein
MPSSGMSCFHLAIFQKRNLLAGGYEFVEMQDKLHPCVDFPNPTLMVMFVY